MTGAGERRQCETGTGFDKCDGARCFPQGKLLACFKSPFSKGVAVKGNKLPSVKAPAVKATQYFWAFELKDGRKCEGPPAPESSVRWTCKGPKELDEIERLIRSGDGLFAVISGTRQVIQIVRTWK